MRQKFKIGSNIKTTEKISVNSAGNPAMWGIDIEAGALGQVQKYFKPTNFVVPMNARYEVKFVIINCISIALILFERQMKKINLIKGDFYGTSNG